MNMKLYETLPREAVKIRQAVFVEEQGFCEEFDITDGEAKHLVLFDGKTPVATCRFFRKDLDSNHYIIGRIAVIKPYRGKKIGSRLIKSVETEILKAGGSRVFLHAQETARDFYEKQGYLACSEIDFDENCPHIWMCKEIGGGQ